MTFHRLFDGSKAQKLRKCPECGGKFIPLRKVQPTCENLACMQLFALKVVAKAERKREKVERANDRQKREQLKTRSQWIQDTQKVVNQVRRLEELAKGCGCMSCNRSQQEVESTDGWKPGGAWDAGHYLAVGARPEHRFNPINIWLQCKSCNGGAGKYIRKNHTVSMQYRKNLIATIGLEAVEALEADQEPKHYTIEDLKAIKAENVAKLKEIKA